MKKILIIIPVLLLLLPINASAANFGDINVTIPEKLQDTALPYYIIWEHSGTKHLVLSSKPAKVSERIAFVGSLVHYTLNNGTWKITYDTGNLDPEKDYLYPLSFSTYHHSNYDVMHEDTGELVFPKAPIKVSLYEIMNRTKMGAVMETVAKMVPVVMIAMVGFLGFRKAFNLLLKVFHQA